MAPLEVRFQPAINAFDAADWDALRPDDNPFLGHAFLALLENSGCIRVAWGWRAHHLGLYRDQRLVAAAPLYLKSNSHGEFVFDGSWASAFERAGGDYYPKLLNAVPYSPVSGPRLLTGQGDQAAMLRRALVTAMRRGAEQLGLSSAHANFLPAQELAAFDDAWLIRSDLQFHWHNQGYADFEQFLSTLHHKKRKNIRQERAQVARAPLRLEWCSGTSLSTAEWRRIHQLYEATFDAKGNHAALTADFFAGLGKALGEAVQLSLTRDGDGQIVAMALFLRSADTLYGRYWGASIEQPGLHFELCYYRGIDYAIAQGLARFEPGAQGEHKLARGFLPTLTHSRHYLVHLGFRDAVRHALVRETEAVRNYASHLMAHSPYTERPHGDRSRGE